MKKYQQNIEKFSYTTFEEEIEDIQKLLTGEGTTRLDVEPGPYVPYGIEVNNTTIPVREKFTNYCGTKPAKEKVDNYKLKDSYHKELVGKHMNLKILIEELKETKEPWKNHVDLLRCLGGYGLVTLNEIYKSDKRKLLTEKTDIKYGWIGNTYVPINFL